LRPKQNEIFDTQMKVYGLKDGQFLINHYWIDGSVIIFPNRFFMWNIADAEEIKPHTLEIMNFVKPRPDYLIIGTGETNVMLDETFYEHFRRMGISVDTCPTFEACSTFNMCIEDQYNVACALLQPMIPRDNEGNEIMPAEEGDLSRE
jgi:NADH dehydrogenase [ubiquinone] 1 alpha subcomplex assembly factor 3